EDFGRPGGILPQHPEVEVGAIGVIVHCEHFGGLAALVQVSRPVDYQVKRLARLLVGEVFVHQLACAPGIYEVIKTDARDVIFFEKVEYAGNLPHVEPVHCKAQPDLYSGVPAGHNTFHGLAEGAFDSSEPVIYFIEPIEAYTNVGEADFFEVARYSRIDQGPVG